MPGIGVGNHRPSIIDRRIIDRRSAFRSYPALRNITGAGRQRISNDPTVFSRALIAGWVPHCGTPPSTFLFLHGRAQARGQRSGAGCRSFDAGNCRVKPAKLILIGVGLPLRGGADELCSLLNFRSLRCLAVVYHLATGRSCTGGLALAADFPNLGAGL
jgi:hypothetical protein